MVIESKAELGILNVLCSSPFIEHSILELSRLSGVTKKWIYEKLKKLEKQGLVLVKKGNLKINFNNYLSAKLKEMFDMEKIYSLNNERREKILSIFETIRHEFKQNLISFLVVGSVAKQKYTKKSDIDFLIITEHKQDMDLTRFGDINVIDITMNGFREKFLDGDEFIMNSLSSGLLLFDNNFIIEYYKRPLLLPDQNQIREKITNLEEICERMGPLIRQRDTERLKENLIYMLSQIIRIKLIRIDIFPGTKSELAGQIKKIDKELANDFRLLLGEIPNKKIMELALKYVGQNFRSL